MGIAVKDTALQIPEIAGDGSRTTQEYVYARLRNAIMVGAIEPGTSLTMRGLAESLAISPTPIREAVRRLSSERAIEVKDNRRMTVPTMTVSRFDELIALRVALETHAAQRSLPYISDIIIQKMTDIDDLMDVKVEEGAIDEIIMLNQQFHRSLYMANPDQVAMNCIESVWLQLGPFQRQASRRISEFYLVDHHKEIIAGLRARDPKAVAAGLEGDIVEGTARSGRSFLLQSDPDSSAA